MLLACKTELRPTPEQADYLSRACGARRHCYNQLLDHFSQPDVKWSTAAAYRHDMKVLRVQFPWYNEVSSRVTRNAIDDLDNAFKHFFRRVREKTPANPKAKTFRETSGFPQFKKKGRNDSFAMREENKFDVEGRTLRIEKLKTRIKLRQRLRFTGKTKQVTISRRAGKFYASILIETADDNPHAPCQASVGVDFGIKEGSNRRAKAKLKVAKLHARISNQRQAVLHELSDKPTRTDQVITIEDLNVKGMVRNRRLARAVSDAGFGELRRQIEYKAQYRGVTVVFADRFFPSSKMCHACGQTHDMPLSKRQMVCDCGHVMDRDLNAAKNLDRYGLDRPNTLRPDVKRTQEPSKPAGSPTAAVMTA